MSESRLPEEFYNRRQLSPKYQQAHTPSQLQPPETFDTRPSRFPMRVIENGRLLIFRMDVLGEGTMELVIESGAFGKISYRGMRLVVQE